MPGGMTAEQRETRARLAALTLHSKHDSRELTVNARAAFLAKFIDQVDPRRELDEHERLRRADYARKAHFARMALKASRKRTAQANARTRAEQKQTAEGDERSAAAVEILTEVLSDAGGPQPQST